MIDSILNNIKMKNPLVHCITNYVTVNDCANIILACNASPVMADDEMEVSEITNLADALCINIGTLNRRTIPSMVKAGKTANEKGIPVILDPVGAGCSTLRTETVLNLIKEIKFAVIKGNISEIKTIAEGSGNTKGVDAAVSDKITDENIETYINFAKELSLKLDSIIAITGPIDIVTDGTKTALIRNGHPLMSKITGTGCMTTSVIGAFTGANRNTIFESTVLAVSSMGLCGELGYEKMIKFDGGTSSLRTFIIDYMSKLNIDTLKGGIKIEYR